MNALFRRFIFCAPIASFVFLLLAASLTAIPSGSRLSGEPAELALLRRAYPDIAFSCVYDNEQKDFKIELARKTAKTSQTAAPASARHIASTPQTAVFYWADGRMLPLEKLGKKESYWSLCIRMQKIFPILHIFPNKTFSVCAIFLRRKTVCVKRACRSTFLTQYTTVQRANRRNLI